LKLFKKLHKITFRLTALSGKMMVFVYLETQDPRHEPRCGGGVSDNLCLSEREKGAFCGLSVSHLLANFAEMRL
jgi:hypothetical protein